MFPGSECILTSKSAAAWIKSSGNRLKIYTIRGILMMKGLHMFKNVYYFTTIF